MPRRRNVVDYDDDDIYDGLDYEEYDENEYGGATSNKPKPSSQRKATHNGSQQQQQTRQAPVSRQDMNEKEALDLIVEEFRLLFTDSSIPRNQIDEALVTAGYDIEAAVGILERKLSEANADSVKSLESSQPSAIARMFDDPDDPCVDGQGVSNVPPGFAFAHIEALQSANAFSGPSPDDVIKYKQNEGRQRAFSLNHPRLASAASSSEVTGSDKSKSTTVSSKQPHSASTTLQTAILGPTGASASQTKPKPKADPPKGIMQRTHPLKLPSASQVAVSSPSVSIVIAGHVDAGKSTLLGHLMRLLGSGTTSVKRRDEARSNKGRSSGKDRQTNVLAWITDVDQVEQERGVTVDILTRTFQGRSTKTVFSVTDAPGHRDFVPSLILGAAQANAALLVVDSSTGEFESGFSRDGQTREHAILLRALGIPHIIVVVNKLDMVHFANSRYEEIKTALSLFFKSVRVNSMEYEVTFVPVSGLEGANLIESPPQDHPLASWYHGPTLLGAIESLPPPDVGAVGRAMSGPTRFVVSDVYRSSTLGGALAVCGRLVSGTVAVKDRMQVCPSSEIAAVKAIEINSEVRRKPGDFVVAGAHNLPITLGMSDIPNSMIIAPGDVLCGPEKPIPFMSSFLAQIIVLDTPAPLIQGMQFDLHVGALYEPAVLSRLVSIAHPKPEVGKSSTKVESNQRRPRRLVAGNMAAIEIRVNRTICIETAAAFQTLNRLILRVQGRTVAVGIATRKIS